MLTASRYPRTAAALTGSIHEAIVAITAVDVTGPVVLERRGRAGAVNEQVVGLRELHHGHLSAPFKRGEPRVEVIGHGDLVVAAALQEQQRLGDRPGQEAARQRVWRRIAAPIGPAPAASRMTPATSGARSFGLPCSGLPCSGLPCSGLPCLPGLLAQLPGVAQLGEWLLVGRQAAGDGAAAL